jgi:uncharacterized damage-inducible protein DinB
MQDDVVALFAYDRWANTKVLGACRQLTAEQSCFLGPVF